MNRMDVERFRRQGGKPVQLTVRNEEGIEDTFVFMPFNADQWERFLVLSTKFDEGSMNMDKEGASDIMILLKDIVKNSYPELPMDIVGSFVVHNFVAMLEMLPRLAPKSVEEDTKAKLLAKIATIKEEKK